MAMGIRFVQKIERQTASGVGNTSGKEWVYSLLSKGEIVNSWAGWCGPVLVMKGFSGVVRVFRTL